MNHWISRGTQRVSSSSMRLQHLLDQRAAGRRRIEDLEALRQIRVAPVQAQQPVRDAVERADPHRRARHAEQLLDAAAHLARGLVRERHGEDAVRRRALDLDDPGDAVREHARLAAAGAGEHQHRPERGGDGLALRVVEGVENRGEVHEGAHCTVLFYWENRLWRFSGHRPSPAAKSVVFARLPGA